MGAPPDSDREAISGFECLHRIAQSYLGPLWIASDVRSEGGPLRLVRRLALPEGTPAAARSQIATLARRATHIEHPNVLRVLDMADSDGLLVGVYESAEAEPLRSLQSWANLRGLSFPVGVALRILVDLLQGVEALHALGRAAPELGVAGGLAPDSVLISRSGATQLSDPLIASGAALLEGIGFNTAKLAYAAPEQVHAVAALTPRADLFTCGAMLWELLASRRLLAGSRPAIERKLLEHNLPSLRSSLRGPQQVSDALVELVERSLAADPAARPASAAELAEALGSAGHELASLEEVAAFVGKLSGPRFDRRTAAIRSRTPQPFDEVKASAGVPKGATLLGVAPVGVIEPPSDIETPRATSVAASTTRGADAAPPVDDAAESAEDTEETAPSSEPSSPFFLGKGAFAPAPVEPPGLGLTPPSPPVQGGPLWNSMVTAATPKVSVPSPLSPFGSRTIKGIASPEHPALAVSQPFANITPEPFSAVKTEAEAPPKKPEGDAARVSSDPFAAPASVAAPPRPRNPFDAPPEPAPPRPRSPFDEPSPDDALGGREAAVDVARPSRPSNPFDAPADTGAPRPSQPFDAPAVEAGGATPFQHLLPRSKGARTSQAPHAQSYFDLSSPAAPSVPAAAGNSSIFSRYKLAIGLGAGALVVAVGVWLALGRSSAPGVTASRDVPASGEPSVPASSEQPAATTKPSEPPAAPVPSAADAGAKAAEPAKVASAPAESAPPARAADFAAAQLDDSQLVVLFALEGRNTLPTCAERLGDAAGKYTGNDLRRSQLQIKAAKRQLGKGDTAAAHELACSAVAHNPQNAAAQRNLAEIALQLGDAAQAKAAVDKGLARSPKDKGLMALSGDVLAMMGDIAGGRAMWLRTAPPRGSKAARTKRLVTAYRKLGDKALASSNWVQAATYFRRAVILTRGSFAPSLGLSEALLWLDRSRAALVWAERAAQASPKDSRTQVLFGDALYENGQNEKARAAWQAALDVQPTNRLAARRLREGKP